MDFVGPAREELMTEELNDVVLTDDDLNEKNFGELQDSASLSTNTDDSNSADPSAVLEYKSWLLQKCLDILDVEHEECAISEDFMFRIMFHLRYKETIALTQKLLYGYSKFALVEMTNCRIEYYKKCQTRQECKDIISNFFGVGRESSSNTDATKHDINNGQLAKKKPKKKLSQQRRRSSDRENQVSGGGGGQNENMDVMNGACCVDYYRNNRVDRRNIVFRRGCGRCMSGKGSCKCGNNNGGADNGVDWAYEEIINGLQGREIDSLTPADLTVILVKAMTEDICDHETGDVQAGKAISDVLAAHAHDKATDGGAFASKKNTSKMARKQDDAASAVGLDDETIIGPSETQITDSKDAKTKTGIFVDEEKRIFDMLVERYGRHMEHNRLDYYSGKNIVGCSLVVGRGLNCVASFIFTTEYLRKLVVLGITLLLVLLIALHFV
jgi:hypothetical protein